jgi:hypothetical protein
LLTDSIDSVASEMKEELNLKEENLREAAKKLKVAISTF